LKVAVMGCVVNGPGEAKEADIGIAGGKGRGVIFRKGEVVRTCNEDEFFEALVEEGERVIAEMDGEEPQPRKDGVIPLTVVN
jgi:(E)-4-hydroxy-3-methylbut-2-enyl-diphosphate synthase